MLDGDEGQRRIGLILLDALDILRQRNHRADRKDQLRHRGANALERPFPLGLLTLALRALADLDHPRAGELPFIELPGAIQILLRVDDDELPLAPAGALRPRHIAQRSKDVLNNRLMVGHRK